MAGTIRTLAIKAFAEFDVSALKKGEVASNKLASSLETTGKQTNALGGKSNNLQEKLTGLNGTMNAAGISTGRFGSMVGLLTNPIGLAIAAVAAMVAGFVVYAGVLSSVLAKIHEFGNSQAAIAGELQRTAQAAGISILELSTLRQLFSENNVEANLAADVLKDFGDKIGEALLQPTGNTAKALQDLGVNMQALGAATPFQRLQMIFSALNNVTDATKRARLGNQLLGSNFAKLGNVIGQTPEQIEEVRRALIRSQPHLQEATDLGGALGTQNAKLESSLQGLKETLFVALGPAIIRVTEAITKFIDKINNTPDLVDKIKLGLQLLGIAAAAVGVAFAALGVIMFVSMLPVLAPLFLIAAAVAAALLVIEDLYTFLRGGKSIIGDVVLGFFLVNAQIKSFVRALVATSGPIGRFLDLMSTMANSIVGAANVLLRLSGTDFRLTGGFDFGGDVRASINAAAGPTTGNELLDATIQTNAVRREFGGTSAGFNIPSAADTNIPAAGNTNIPTVAAIPTSMLIANAGTRGNNVVNNHNNITPRTTITINGATDPERVRAVVEDALSTQFSNTINDLASGQG